MLYVLMTSVGGIAATIHPRVRRWCLIAGRGFIRGCSWVGWYSYGYAYFMADDSVRYERWLRDHAQTLS